jgi:hypothetical protein
MNINTTPAHPKQNSYITLSDAESYLTSLDRVASSDSWNDLTDEQKKACLILAAKSLNTFSYKGQKVCKKQPLAFPRLSWHNINVEKKKPFTDFFWATRDENLTQIVNSGEIDISSNALYDRTSSADAFYSPHYNGYIQENQIIKQSGLSCDNYLTIDFIDMDGEYLEIRETISDESSPSSGVDIYTTPLFGIEDNVGKAQTEIAYQFIDKQIISAEELNAVPEMPTRRFELGNTLMVWYKESLSRTGKFSTDRTNSMDIVYLYLGNWITSVGGRLV